MSRSYAEKRNFAFILTIRYEKEVFVADKKTNLVFVVVCRIYDICRM